MREPTVSGHITNISDSVASRVLGGIPIARRVGICPVTVSSVQVIRGTVWVLLEVFLKVAGIAGPVVGILVRNQSGIFCVRIV